MPGTNLTHQEAQERKSVVFAPVEYDVHLDVTKGSQNFKSHTTIRFHAKEEASTFLDLTADSVSSVTLNGVELNVDEVFKDHRIILENLQETNVVSVIALCRYSNTGEGLHRSVDPSDGNVYLYTQFEVPDARRVYAVFDQPDIKAVFNFSVTAPESWLVLSNMPQAEEKAVEGVTAEGTLEQGKVEGKKFFSFEQTPVMSSYLTAICAGPYEQWHTEYNNEDGRVVPLGMYCRKALKDALAKDVDYLFDITKKGFAFYAKTWSVPYPYAKYDQIYVPEYNAGAMENIGLVTLRDQYIFESKVTGAAAERRVITVLHELAHMWFGDYVTMKWWNDLWLNESFAEFTSTLATAEATDWTDSWTTFNSGEKSWGLHQDQLSTTHPIVADIKDLQDTYVNFDGITYAKGAAVLKQLVAYVGRENFFEGIHRYLNKHAYSNATLQDLLTELEATSGRDLVQWSKKWLEQSNVNTLTGKAETTTNSEGQQILSSYVIEQTAPESSPVLRPHRLAVGCYNMHDNGVVERDEQYVLDVDGEKTEVEALRNVKRADCIVINDDDLTYAKLRLDEESRIFAADHLHEFSNVLTRSIIWLSLWDMTQDGQFPAERFIEATLRLLSRETQPTTFRYAIDYLRYAAHTFVASSRQAEVKKHVAHELWLLALDAKPESDRQFQLALAYLAYGVVGDEEFKKRVASLLNGDFTLPGLEIDNNFKWNLIRALARVNGVSNDDIQSYLDERDTTENREFALGARAAIATEEAKKWAWNEAINNQELTNSQLYEVASGVATAPLDLATPFVSQYFATIDYIWSNRSFHMAEQLLRLLYPRYAKLQQLVESGRKWLDDNATADRALRRIIAENLEDSERALRVRLYNEQLLND